MPLAARRFLVAALAAGLLSPAAAMAQGPPPQFIDGSPLNVYSDGRGRFQVVFDGQNGEFAAPPGSLAPNAGLNLAFYDANGGAGPRFGFLGPGGPNFSAEFDPDPLNPPTRFPQPDGSTELRTQYEVPESAGFTPSGPPMRVTERLFYRDGETEVRARYDVTNSDTGFAARFRASLAADTFHASTSEGGGLFSAGPPRAVSTVNYAAGTAISVRDSIAPLWTGHEVGSTATVYDRVRQPGGPGFDGTVAAGPFDDAVGVQWDTRRTTPLVGNTQVFEVIWRFSRFGALALAPSSATPTAGDPHTINVTLQGGGVAPTGGQAIRYAVSGTNPQSGVATTDPNGAAAIQLNGAKAGRDTVEVYWDANGDGTRDPHEAGAEATIDWQRPRLRRGETVQVGLVEGSVLIADRQPSPRGGARTAQLAPFRPLTGIEQIRVGSVLDTRKGTVRLSSASDRLGTRVQRGNFKGSRFQVRQSTTSPITELRLRGGSFRRCARRSGRAAAYTAQRRSIRRLRGSSRGRFRTRGRRSSATVRGTRWIVEDRCAGTLTVVREGSVRVRDFAKRRTVVLRRGQRYLARGRAR